MREDSSPEEKLLKLIRNKNRQSEEGEKNPKGQFKEVKEVKTPIQKNHFLKRLERIFLFISLGLVGYILYEFMFITKDVQDNLKETTASAQIGFERIRVTQPKPYSFYAEKFEKRDIFESPLYQKKEGTTPVGIGTSDLAKNLKLVGIVLDDNKEAIIEDLETRQTFFVHTGERFKDFTVEEIEESKVILIYQDQRVELSQ